MIHAFNAFVILSTPANWNTRGNESCYKLSFVLYTPDTSRNDDGTLLNGVCVCVKCSDKGKIPLKLNGISIVVLVQTSGTCAQTPAEKLRGFGPGSSVYYYRGSNYLHFACSTWDRRKRNYDKTSGMESISKPRGYVLEHAGSFLPQVRAKSTVVPFSPHTHSHINVRARARYVGR